MWAEQSVTGRANPAPIGGVIPLAMADAGVEMQVIVDPSLVGGFVLEIDGTTYNKSVSGQLHRLARRLQER